MIENIILIPVYNDWKSLNHLLLEINKNLSSNQITKILIMDDHSSQKIKIDKTRLKKIKEIKVLSLNRNLGSQKAIAVGLDYLKNLNKSFFITIMDADGEDDPNEISKMILLAKKNVEYVVTSNRKQRNENLLIQICYKIHLIICFMLTWNWISFGNFSCFHSRNLNKIKLNEVWCAFPSAILNNRNIKKLYATRKKRYFGTSKVNLLKLIEHSLRINSIFYNRVFISSVIYFFLIWSMSLNFGIFFYSLILAVNLIIIFIKYKHFSNENIKYKNFLKNLKIIK